MSSPVGVRLKKKEDAPYQNSFHAFLISFSQCYITVASISPVSRPFLAYHLLQYLFIPTDLNIVLVACEAPTNRNIL